MSVINQMLRDLDNRQNHSAGMSFMESMHLRSDAGSRVIRYREKYFWGVLFICSALLCLWLWQRNLTDYSFSTSGQSEAVKVLADPALQEIAARKTSTVRVVGADWQFGRSGSASLILTLAGKPGQAVIQTALASGETEFVLPSVSMDTALPMLKVNDSPFESYRISQRDKDLVLTVKTADNATIATSLKQTESSDQARWVLTTTPIVEEPVRPPEAVASVAVTKANTDSVKSSTADEFRRPPSGVKKVRASYQRALGYVQENRLNAAVGELQKVLQQDSSGNEARELLVTLYQQTGRSMEANVLLKEGIAANPSYLPFTRLYADDLITNGELEQAARVLKNAERYAIGDGDYNALQGAVAQRLSQHDQAVNFYMKALEAQPRNSAWWMGLAISLEALNKKEAAAGAYAAAIDSGRLNSKLLAYVNTRLRNLEQAK